MKKSGAEGFPRLDEALEFYSTRFVCLNFRFNFLKVFREELLEIGFFILGVVVFMSGQLSHKHPEGFLNGEKECGLVGERRGSAGKAQSGTQLVDTATGLNARMSFGDAPIEQKAGLARVAEFCGDAHGGRKA